MSRYVTPFLVFNLGAEMVFVVAQRLGAQNVPHEKSTVGRVIHYSKLFVLYKHNQAPFCILLVYALFYFLPNKKHVYLCYDFKCTFL